MINRLAKNFSSLTLLQVGNYVFPLITFPYLVRVLGPDNFGLINFAAALVLYFGIFSDYGFNIIGTQAIALNENDRSRLNEIFTNIFAVKFVFMLLSLLPFLLLVFMIPRFSSDIFVYLFSFLLVVGTTLSPAWVFQGLERTEFYSITFIIIKTISTFLIFFLIKAETDLLKLIIINGLSLIVISIASIFLLNYKMRISFVRPSFKYCIEYVKNGWYIFLSRITSSVYTNSNVLILGFFTSNEVVGYFAAADKIRLAFQGIFSNLTQALFPHVGKMFQVSNDKAKKFVLKSFWMGFSVVFIIAVLLFINSGSIGDLVLGEKYFYSPNILQVLVFVPVVIWISNIFGVQIILNLNYRKEFFKISLFASIIHVLILPLLILNFSAIGAAIAILFTEAFIATSQVIFVKKKKLINLRPT